MNKLALSTCVAAAGLLLAGCYDYGYYGYGYRPTGYAGISYYDGYYDGFYGPFDEGFWAPDGFFYYGDRDHNFHRGEVGHFRHDGAPGFQRFHTQMAHNGAPAARMSGSSAPPAGGARESEHR